MSRLSLRLVFWLIICGLTTQLQAQHCGTERWSVKTGTDANAATVDRANPQSATIEQLIGLARPNSLPEDTRVAPTEKTVFVVNATLTDYKMEGGSHGDSQRTYSVRCPSQEKGRSCSECCEKPNAR